MRADETSILNLIQQKSGNPVISETVTQAEVKEFIIDLYFELFYLQNILRDNHLETNFGKDGSSLYLQIIEGKSVFSFNLTAEQEQQLFKVHFDYQFERGGNVNKIRYL